MDTDINNTHFRIKGSLENLRRTGYPFVTPLDWDRYRVLEIQKARCRNKIEHHTRNVILQSVISLMCLAGGIYAGQKKSIIVPLILVPTAAESVKRLSTHETKRRHYKEILNGLERN